MERLSAVCERLRLTRGSRVELDRYYGTAAYSNMNPSGRLKILPYSSRNLLYYACTIYRFFRVLNFRVKNFSDRPN